MIWIVSRGRSSTANEMSVEVPFQLSWSHTLSHLYATKKAIGNVRDWTKCSRDYEAEWLEADLANDQLKKETDVDGARQGCSYLKVASCGEMQAGLDRCISQRVTCARSR